jgi:Carboxypeptidase regulatory-like domain
MADFSLNNPGMRKAQALLALVLACPFAADAETGTLTLQGRVRAQDGKPMAGVVLRVTSTMGKSDQQTNTDDSGTFNFTGLQPGYYSLGASLAGFAPLQRSIALEGQSLSIDLVMTATARTPTVPSNVSRQSPTRRQRGFQTLTLQIPENLDASLDGSPAVVGATPAGRT